MKKDTYVFWAIRHFLAESSVHEFRVHAFLNVNKVTCSQWVPISAYF
jgi:hypothetical protein